jgi:hypothetical protein
LLPRIRLKLARAYNYDVDAVLDQRGVVVLPGSEITDVHGDEYVDAFVPTKRWDLRVLGTAATEVVPDVNPLLVVRSADGSHALRHHAAHLFVY